MLNQTGTRHAALICHDAQLGRVVLGQLNAHDIRPWLICDLATASELVTSPLIQGVLLATAHLAGHRAEILSVLNNAEQPLDFVMAADFPGLMILDSIRSRLGPKLFPQADRDTLEHLHNRMMFTSVCLRLGLLTPQCLFYATKEAIDPHAIGFSYPMLLTPINEPTVAFGSRVLTRQHDLDMLLGDPHYQFRKLMLQPLDGTMLDHSVLCYEGRIIADSNWTMQNSHFVSMVATIIAHLKYTGCARFQAMLNATGVRLVSCIPGYQQENADLIRDALHMPACTARMAA